MNGPELSHLDRSWQQLLAAYCDGELAEEVRLVVENWLQDQPELAAELAQQRQLSASNQALWQSVTPNFPDEARWSTVYRNILASVQASRERPLDSGSRIRRLRRSWPFLLAVPLLGGAAAILFALLPQGGKPVVLTKGGEDAAEKVYSVATQEDVDIVSVRPADWPHVVVGEHPLGEKVIFVSAADINVQGLQPDWDGMTPQLQSGTNSGMPMVIAPLPRAP